MAIPRRYNPLTALRDLRGFLASRQKHELIFAFLAIFLTGTLLVGFYVDSNLKRPWKRPEIQYVQDWRLDRTDAEIIAQQKIDAVQAKADAAKLEKLKAERRAEFKKVDDALNRLGI